jgi:16S rRNA (guanine527-N7)-methyltransferase
MGQTEGRQRRMIPQDILSEAQAALSGWGTTLPLCAWEQLDRYLQDVLEYGRKVNLTAAKDVRTLVFRHVLDGLAAVKPLRERLDGPAPCIADIGAGAGFIGISLKVAWPEARVTLAEASYRKYCFLNWSSARLGLKGLRILQERMRDCGTAPGGDFDAALARALAPLPDAVGIVMSAVRPGGWGAVYQSVEPDPDSEPLRRALTCVKSRLESVSEYRLPGENQCRYLSLLRKEVQ